MKTVLLAGGTGGAKLAVGLQTVLPPGDLTVIANTADDDEFWGLHVSLDVDSVIYRLAGVLNETSGWGRADETFNAMTEMHRLGQTAWFQIGDRDLAAHVLRTDMLRRGCTLTETSLELCGRFGLHTRVLPMTDGKVRTRFVTDAGRLSFQEYFVREHLAPRLMAVEIDGPEARESPEVRAALDEADLVVIGPSNPVISIAPILKVVGGFDRTRTIAVTPIVGGVALKGPTVAMMSAVGMEPTPVRVASEYRTVAGGFVLDSRDAGLAPSIEELGYRVIVCDTVMNDDGGRRLAQELIKAWS